MSRKHGDISIRKDRYDKWRRTFHTGPVGPDGLNYDICSEAFETREEAENFRHVAELHQPQAGGENA